MTPDTDYLAEVKDRYDRIEKAELGFRQERHDHKVRLAQAIEQAKFEGDYSIVDIAKYLGITRQAVNQVLVDIFGIRYQERSEAAKLGHTQNGKTRQETKESRQPS